MCKMDNQQGPTVRHRELCSMLRVCLDGKGVWGKIHTYTCTIESFFCPRETITTLLIGYTPIQNKEFCLKKCSHPSVSRGHLEPCGNQNLPMLQFPTVSKPCSWICHVDVKGWLCKNQPDLNIDILGFCDLFEKYQCYWNASLVAQMVKNPAAMWETWVWSLGGEDPLEGAMVTHSSILAWRIPWTEEPDRMYSPWGHKERTHLSN